VKSSKTATGTNGDQAITHTKVLGIAVPIILSNVTEPLIGVADTAVLGQLGDAHLIGAAALGATIFSMVFWAFGFLRMGTSGLTAQADGARNDAEVVASLGRALLIAIIAGFALILLQWPIAKVVFAFIQGSAAVEDATRSYFTIRIWSAPAALANFAILGWLIGIARTDLALIVQLVLNLLNIALDVIFVMGLGYGIEGVAIGTVLAQFVAVVVGLALVRSQVRRRSAMPSFSEIIERSKLVRTLSVNRDIMIRTLVLLAAFVFFMAESTRAGDLTLAANSVLMNLESVAIYLLDGFAYSAQVLVGNAVGANQRAHFSRAAWLSSLWAGVISLCLCLIFWMFGETFIDWMTVNEEVREAARRYLIWLIIIPAVGVAAFQLDGIFIGATRTVDMRNMSVVSTGAYFAAWALLTPAFGNHGLWASLIVLFVARALSLLACYPAMMRKLFPVSDGAPQSAKRNAARDVAS